MSENTNKALFEPLNYNIIVPKPQSLPCRLDLSGFEDDEIWGKSDLVPGAVTYQRTVHNPKGDVGNFRVISGHQEALVQYLASVNGFYFEAFRLSDFPEYDDTNWNTIGGEDSHDLLIKILEREMKKSNYGAELYPEGFSMEKRFATRYREYYEHLEPTILTDLARYFAETWQEVVSRKFYKGIDVEDLSKYFLDLMIDPFDVRTALEVDPNSIHIELDILQVEGQTGKENEEILVYSIIDPDVPPTQFYYVCNVTKLSVGAYFQDALVQSSGRIQFSVNGSNGFHRKSDPLVQGQGFGVWHNNELQNQQINLGDYRITLWGMNQGGTYSQWGMWRQQWNQCDHWMN